MGELSIIMRIFIAKIIGFGLNYLKLNSLFLADPWYLVALYEETPRSALPTSFWSMSSSI
jgi:hypothetical protein